MSQNANSNNDNLLADGRRQRPQATNKNTNRIYDVIDSSSGSNSQARPSRRQSERDPTQDDGFDEHHKSKEYNNVSSSGSSDDVEMLGSPCPQPPRRNQQQSEQPPQQQQQQIQQQVRPNPPTQQQPQQPGRPMGMPDWLQPRFQPINGAILQSSHMFGQHQRNPLIQRNNAVNAVRDDSAATNLEFTQQPQPRNTGPPPRPVPVSDNLASATVAAAYNMIQRANDPIIVSESPPRRDDQAPVDLLAAAAVSESAFERRYLHAINKAWTAANRFNYDSMPDPDISEKVVNSTVTPQIIETCTNNFNRAVYAAQPHETGLGGTHIWANKITPICGACGIFVLDCVIPVPHHIGERAIVKSLRLTAALPDEDVTLLRELHKIFTFDPVSPDAPAIELCIERKAIVTDFSRPGVDVVRAEAERQAAPTDNEAAQEHYLIGRTAADDEEDEQERNADSLFDHRYNVAAAAPRRRAAAQQRNKPAAANTNNNVIDVDGSAAEDDDQQPDVASGAAPDNTVPDLPLAVILQSPIVFFCADCDNHIFGKKPRTPALCLATGFIPMSVVEQLPLPSELEKIGFSTMRVYMTVVNMRFDSASQKLQGHVYAFEHNSPEILANDLSKRGTSRHRPWFFDCFQMMFVGTLADYQTMKKKLLTAAEDQMNIVLPMQIRLPTSNELWVVTMRPHVLCAWLLHLSATNPDYKQFQMYDRSTIARDLQLEMISVISTMKHVPEDKPPDVPVDVAGVRDLATGIDHHQLIAGSVKNFDPGDALEAVRDLVAPILQEAATLQQADSAAFNRGLHDQIEVRNREQQQQHQNAFANQQNALLDGAAAALEQEHENNPDVGPFQKRVTNQSLRVADDNSNNNVNNNNIIVNEAAANAHIQGMAKALRRMLSPDLAARFAQGEDVGWANVNGPVRMDLSAAATTDHTVAFDRDVVATMAAAVNAPPFPVVRTVEDKRTQFLKDPRFIVNFDSPPPAAAPPASADADPSSSRDLSNCFISQRGDKMFNDVDVVKYMTKHFPWYFQYGSAGIGPRRLVGKPKWFEKLLLHSGSLFSFDPSFQLMNADRSQRMAVARSAALSVKIRIDRIKTFIDMVSKHDFLPNIDAAVKAKDDVALLKMWTKLAPVLNVSYSTVPFSPAQRVLTLTDLFSLTNFFGPAAFFVTFAPDDTNNALALKIMRLNRNTHMGAFGWSPIAIFDHPDAVLIASERFVIPDELPSSQEQVLQYWHGTRYRRLRLPSSLRGRRDALVLRWSSPVDRSQHNMWHHGCHAGALLHLRDAEAWRTSCTWCHHRATVAGTSAPLCRFSWIAESRQ